MHSDIFVTLNAYQQSDLSFVESEWLALEKKSNSTFFLTWAWVGPWLIQLCNKQQSFYLLCAKKEEEIVGLSIIVKKNRKVLGLFNIQQWWLNRSGDELLDQCWIEENNFLMAANNEADIQQAMLRYIQNSDTWTEFIIGMSDQSTIDCFSSLSVDSYILHDDKGYKLTYQNIKNSEQYTQSVLSRNTRQKLKQSEKLLSKDGTLTIKSLSTSEDKLKHIDVIASLHIKRWEDTLTPSGFTNNDFKRIFTKVIQSEDVEILYLVQKEKSLGYLIFFLYGDKVSFYLSALTSNSDNKIKLGMLFHQKAMMYYLGLGFTEYDFLAGDARYKKSLTNNFYCQQIVCFYRQKFILITEKWLKKLKNKIKSFLQ